MKKIIAIDGPAASGKSSAAKLLAGRLNALFASTGSLYRLLALAYHKLSPANNPSKIDQPLVDKLLAETQITYRNNDWLMNGKAYGEELRDPEIAILASSLATLPEVRQFLLDVQRKLAEGDGVLVMEGRDIGTAIFPEADLKIFLNPSPLVRAKRRMEQENIPFSEETLNAIAEAIALRDKQDRERTTAPLRKADDAIEINSDHNSLEDTVNQIYALAKKVVAE